MINLIIGLVVGSIATLFTMSLLKAASDADDKLLGDDQYEQNN